MLYAGDGSVEFLGTSSLLEVGGTSGADGLGQSPARDKLEHLVNKDDGKRDGDNGKPLLLIQGDNGEETLQWHRH